MGNNKESISIDFIIRNGKLVPSDRLNQLRFNELVKQTKEGSKLVGMFLSEEESGTFPQLQKIHAMINDITKENGDTPDDFKLEVKRAIGMTYMQGNKLAYRSFGKASITELSAAIEYLYHAGAMVGIDFAKNLNL